MSKWNALVFSGVLGFLISPTLARDKAEQVVSPIVWKIDNLMRVGGHHPSVLGNPQPIVTPLGSALAFDGKGAGLLIDANPLCGATQFTVEILFRPE